MRSLLLVARTAGTSMNDGRHHWQLTDGTPPGSLDRLWAATGGSAMADLATPNLPSRDFEATEAFYGPLGFGRRYRDPGWLILERGTLTLEFFPYPDLDPATSSFGCCLRLDDLDAFHAVCTRAGIVAAPRGFPRLTTPKVEASGMRIAYLLDPDGTLLRLVENPTKELR